MLKRIVLLAVVAVASAVTTYSTASMYGPCPKNAGFFSRTMRRPGSQVRSVNGPDPTGFMFAGLSSMISIRDM